jgi:hypothetical protein
MALKRRSNTDNRRVAERIGLFDLARSRDARRRLRLLASARKFITCFEEHCRPALSLFQGGDGGYVEPKLVRSGQTQKSERVTVRSGSAPTADIVGKISHVRKVPFSDSCSARNGS